MTTQDTIKEIKLELRAAMNGVVAAQMRQAGMPYKLIFGVELPRLQEIAREFRADRRLAQALWNESSRECKILATMLMPPAECLSEIAEIWTDEMPTAEIAQIAVQQLFSHTQWAADTAFCWIASDHAMRQLCGFLIISRLLARGEQFNQPALDELRDQAEASIPEASLPLRKAITSVLERLPNPTNKAE